MPHRVRPRARAARRGFALGPLGPRPGELVARDPRHLDLPRRARRRAPAGQPRPHPGVVPAPRGARRRGRAGRVDQRRRPVRDRGAARAVGGGRLQRPDAGRPVLAAACRRPRPQGARRPARRPADATARRLRAGRPRLPRIPRRPRLLRDGPHLELHPRRPAVRPAAARPVAGAAGRRPVAGGDDPRGGRTRVAQAATARPLDHRSAAAAGSAAPAGGGGAVLPQSAGAAAGRGPARGGTRRPDDQRCAVGAPDAPVRGAPRPSGRHAVRAAPCGRPAALRARPDGRRRPQLPETAGTSSASCR